MTTPTSTRQTALGLLGVLVVLASSADTLPAAAPGVRPADASGPESGAVTHSLAYPDALRAAGLRFTVTGGVDGLAPGVWREIPVRVTNPGPVAVRVTGLQLHLAADSTPPGCTAATNLEVRQPRLAGTAALVVPARSTVTLPARGVSSAAIRFRDLATVNQDVCKSKSFALTWSGTARL